jgi:UDP-N-acetylmuramoylalanine--D-glutamate ligase
MGEKKAGVIGLGVSGKKISEALLKLKYHPIAFEKKRKEEFFKKEENIRFFEENKDKIEFVFDYKKEDIIKRKKEIDFFVLSSGVKHEEFAKNEINFISELDFVYQNLPKNSKVILITGTKGKGSTTLMTSKILKKLRLNHFVGGNIGEVEGKISTLSDSILSDDLNKVGIFLFEVSSFQLRSSSRTHPYTLAISCIEKDHLDYHPSFFDYFFSKIKLSTQSEFIVYSEKFAPLSRKYEVSKVISSSIVSFEKILDVEWREEKIAIKERKNGREIELDVDGFEIDGIELEGAKSNALCAVGILTTIVNPEDLKKIKIESIQKKFSFEILGKVNVEGKEIIVINDSKSTNLISLKNAILSLKGRKIVLIAGGRVKGFSFSEIKDVLSETEVFLIGEAKEEIAKDLGKGTICQNLEDAFRKSIEFIKKSSEKEFFLLFSPGCASFPDFESAEHRGKEFERIFKDFKETNK